MEILNFKHGVEVNEPVQPVPLGIRKKFYWKNLARLSYSFDIGFAIHDPTEYQPTFNFLRTEITLIKDETNIVPVPATDNELFTLLSNYFYAAPINAVPSLAQIVDVSGAVLTFNEGDNGKVFLASLPSANKTYTLPVGLSKGWHAEVFKMYSGNTLTFVPSVGMTLLGATLAMGPQYSKMEIIYITPTTAILTFNL